MSRTRRQYRDVACVHQHFPAVCASQHQPRVTAREAEHLVGRRMVMMEVIHAITPLWRPSISPELRFHL